MGKLKAYVKEHKARPFQPRPKGSKLRVFSDCAGISAETIALTLLGLKQFFTIVGGSEIDEVKRCLIGVVHETCRTSCKSESFATDIFQRDPKDSPGADIYLAGFPCPAFSKMGRRFGLRDSKKRGIPGGWTAVHSLPQAARSFAGASDWLLGKEALAGPEDASQNICCLRVHGPCKSLADLRPRLAPKQTPSLGRGLAKSHCRIPVSQGLGEVSSD